MTAMTGERQKLVRSESDRWWDRVRWAIALLALVASVLVVTTGTRETSYGVLVGKVAMGEVRSVEIIGELSDDAVGFSTVEVRWSEGWRHYFAEVRQVRDQSQGGVTPADGDAVLRQSPSAQLTQLQPSLQITRTDPQKRDNGGFSMDIFDWAVSGWLGYACLGLILASLAVLIVGPEPWRATRWAWFWLSAVPLSLVVFVLVSGPTRGIAPPREVNRRLTGGWAFLLAGLLVAMLRPQMS